MMFCTAIRFALLYIGHACFMTCFGFAIGACCQYAVLRIAMIHALLLALISYSYIYIYIYTCLLLFPVVG